VFCDEIEEKAKTLWRKFSTWDDDKVTLPKLAAGWQKSSFQPHLRNQHDNKQEYKKLRLHTDHISNLAQTDAERDHYRLVFVGDRTWRHQVLIFNKLLPQQARLMRTSCNNNTNNKSKRLPCKMIIRLFATSIGDSFLLPVYLT